MVGVLKVEESDENLKLIQVLDSSVWFGTFIK